MQVEERALRDLPITSLGIYFLAIHLRTVDAVDTVDAGVVDTRLQSHCGPN